jgi:hypothetical protein
LSTGIGKLLVDSIGNSSFESGVAIFLGLFGILCLGHSFAIGSLFLPLRPKNAPDLKSVSIFVICRLADI